MVAAHPLSFHLPSSNDEQRIVLSNVPWATYVILREADQHAALLAFRHELRDSVKP